MDKRTLATKIAKLDSNHQAHPVKQYLDRAATCNDIVVIKTIDGSVSMYIENGSVAPYVPKSQSFAIWFGADPENSEEPVADQEHKFKLNSLLKYFQ